MEPNGPVRVHLVPFVHCQSYRLVRVNLDPPVNEQGESLESSLRNPGLAKLIMIITNYVLSTPLYFDFQRKS